jgi:membrane fusion protein (multidrug efflux system)
VVGPNNKTATRPVTVGNQVGSNWIITSGIRAGDRVVTEGNDKIRGPMPVRPTTEQATSQGGR